MGWERVRSQDWEAVRRMSPMRRNQNSRRGHDQIVVVQVCPSLAVDQEDLPGSQGRRHSEAAEPTPCRRR